jgi:peptide/nickel transport system substrate-binding protein/microcin C transport system substrate-binding protein
MRFINEENVSLELLKKGDLDYMALSPELFVKSAVGAPFGETVLKKQVQNKAPGSYAFVGWNFKKPMFQGRKTRVALAMMMNRDLMIKKFEYGMSLPATGPWYQQSMFASPRVKPFPFDPKAALKLLREEGWKDSDKDGVLDKVIDGKKTDFRFTIVGASKDREKYMTIYREDLKKIGIDAEVKTVEWNTFVKLLDERNFDAVFLAWGGGSVDNDPKQIWHTQSAEAKGSNFIHYSNPEVDGLIDKARTLLDRKDRIPVMHKIYETIAADAPYVFLFNAKYTLYGVNRRIGMEKDTYQYSIGSDYWWIKP